MNPVFAGTGESSGRRARVRFSPLPSPSLAAVARHRQLPSGRDGSPRRQGSVSQTPGRVSRSRMTPVPLARIRSCRFPTCPPLRARYLARIHALLLIQTDATVRRAEPSRLTRVRGWVFPQQLLRSRAPFFASPSSRRTGSSREARAIMTCNCTRMPTWPPASNEQGTRCLVFVSSASEDWGTGVTLSGSPEHARWIIALAFLVCRAPEILASLRPRSLLSLLPLCRSKRSPFGSGTRLARRTASARYHSDLAALHCTFRWLHWPSVRNEAARTPVRRPPLASPVSRAPPRSLRPFVVSC